MDSGCHHSCLWVLWSPFGGQGSLNPRYGGLQGLFRRCPYSGHLWRCWVVYAPNLRQILWPRSASHSWLCCSLAVAVHSTHWAGIGNSGGVDISVPLAFSTQLDVPGGERPGYVCNPGSPRERDAASQGHISGIPTRALLHSWKLAPAAHHVLLSILVVTSPAPDVWLSILTDYTYDSELDIADGVPLAFSTQRLVPSGNQGYIRNLDGFSYDHLHCFECVQLQVVKTAPDSQLFNLLSVSRLVTVLDEADQCGIVCKL